MESIKMIDAIDVDFFPRDLLLINNNKDNFEALTLIYSKIKLKELVDDFIKLGNKRFKTKSRKLEYLAMYQTILNHAELCPTKENVEEDVRKILSEMGLNLEFSITNENDKTGIEKEPNLDEKEDDEPDFGDFYANNKDIIYKWSRIMVRLSEVDRAYQEAVQNAVDKGLREAGYIGEDGEFENIVPYIPSENGENLEHNMYL